MSSNTEPVKALASTEMLNLEGESVRLGSLWAETPIVLALIWHFG